MALLLSVAEPSHQSYLGIYHWQWRPLKAIQCYDAYSAFSRGFLTDKRLVWANDNSAGQTGRVRFDRKIPVKQNLRLYRWNRVKSIALKQRNGTSTVKWLISNKVLCLLVFVFYNFEQSQVEGKGICTHSVTPVKALLGVGLPYRRKIPTHKRLKEPTTP